MVPMSCSGKGNFTGAHPSGGRDHAGVHSRGKGIAWVCIAAGLGGQHICIMQQGMGEGDHGLQQDRDHVGIHC